MAIRRRVSHDVCSSSSAEEEFGQHHVQRGAHTWVTLALATILLSLGVTCITTAHLLCTSRHSATQLAPSFISNIYWSDELPAFVPPALANSPSSHKDTPASPLRSRPDVKYLSYSPHSGFHNQRIALENALTLAVLLNRTLLLPPARLGAALGYAPSKQMRERAPKEETKRGHERCMNVTDRDDPECAGFMKWTHLPWNFLVDIDSIIKSTGVKTREHWEFGVNALPMDLLFSEDDIWALDDTTVYNYRFLDTSPRNITKVELSNIKLSKSFSNASAVVLSDLTLRPERLVRLGSLFGSSRIWLHNPAHERLRRTIRHGMTFQNKHIQRAADDIGVQLGGHWFGVHVRLGDGLFAEQADFGARTVFWRLIDELAGDGELNVDAVARMAKDDLVLKKKTKQPQHRKNLDHPLVNFSSTPSSNASACPHLSCQAPLHPNPRLSILNTPLFIATDAPSPHTHPSLDRFRTAFPCTFFLDDFANVSLAHLDGLRNPYDNLPLRPFLEPMVDAVIVSRVEVFVGTAKSTFSQFVADVLARVWRGEEIVERGALP